MPRIFSILAFGCTLALTPLAVLAQAQGAQVAFGSMKGDPTLPVEVTSDQLNVNQADGTAIFTGAVLVVQGEMRMTAERVQVFYAEDGKKISRMHATGGVTLTNGGEAAEGQEAVYTIDTGGVVMTGDVLLTQGSSAISGKKLTVDLNTGTGVMEGRVQTVFVPATAGQ
ncbi:MAG: lipopolysaccharide transport periplasmic protein LptA [Cereibacter sphaeroides]|uniref:Lipopolysaccharide transport periplasmic protein LptA n=1 Tax=Cereibacter sphaeroides TaxID=1063 RepID=A0A2W5S9Z5_CERSP|nr:MAG: lipopolysaccharide transport periplasmic protein LptA [Cereibacter sphaeroides]